MKQTELQEFGGFKIGDLVLYSPENSITTYEGSIESIVQIDSDAEEQARLGDPPQFVLYRLRGGGTLGPHDRMRHRD